MCENCVTTLRAAEQWTLVAEIERTLIAAEADAGLSVPDAVRPLTDAELLARVNFGDIAALMAAANIENEQILTGLREALVAGILNQLGGDATTDAEAARRLLALFTDPPKEVAAAIAEASAQLGGVLRGVYAGAVAVVGEEVVRQGLVPAGFEALTAPDAVLSAQAHAVAGQHWGRLTETVRKHHLTPSAVLQGALTKEALRRTLDDVSLAGAFDAARQGVHTAHGAGRVDAAGMQGCSHIWASELLDGRTCDNCAAIDGHFYASMADAKSDYPMGGYRSCRGEARCRGTLVFLYQGAEGAGAVDGDGNVTGSITV